jgi:hypothetical protein
MIRYFIFKDYWRKHRAMIKRIKPKWRKRLYGYCGIINFRRYENNSHIMILGHIMQLYFEIEVKK